MRLTQMQIWAVNMCGEKVQIRVRLRLHGLRGVRVQLNILKEDNFVWKALSTLLLPPVPFSLTVLPHLAKMLA